MQLKEFHALTLCLGLLASTGCTMPLYENPAPIFIEQIQGSSTPSPAMTGTASPATIIVTTVSPFRTMQAAPGDFCADLESPRLISGLKTALQREDGEALASLVSPVHGTDVRLFRNGSIVNYDQEKAKFLFVSTSVVDWGAAPGSGLETKGSFHDLIVPALMDVLNKNYSLTCNQVQVGGTTYAASWPYAGINFYSVYDPGTRANENLDWQTWLVGMQYVNGKPYLYVIMQFQWEP
jgi:hypothetical protein